MTIRTALVGVLSIVLSSSLRAAEASPTVSSGEKSQEYDSAPLVRSWTPAKFPKDATPTVASATATIRVIIDEAGAITSARVLKTSDPAFGEAAMVAAKQWTFSPGLDAGKPVPMCLDLPFVFTAGKQPKPGFLPPAGMLPQLAPRTSAELRDAPLGEYPATLVGRGLPGTILFACKVDPDGNSSGLRILEASHADFVLPALLSYGRWRFTGAKQGDLPATVEMRGDVMYSDTRTPPRTKVLAANGITAPDGGEAEAMPRLVSVADPVWPYDLLLNDETGSAAVEFTVLANGVVANVRVREASHPAFGAALKAALQTWRFEPALVAGKGVDVALVQRTEFKEAAAGASGDEWRSRLVPLVRKNAIGGGRGLDEPLTPFYRVQPVPPDSLREEKGGATIEFVIDRDGRARMPKIVSATKEEFGWAAATALSQWVFKAPRRGGQPTEVKVQIPVGF